MTKKGAGRYRNGNPNSKKKKNTVPAKKSDPNASKNNEAARDAKKFTVQPVFGGDSSPEVHESPKLQNPQIVSNKASGDHEMRQLERKLPSLTIDCSGDGSFSSDSGISISPPQPRARRTPFERYSESSSLALRQRTVSESVPSPGVRGILKMPSTDDIFQAPMMRRKKHVSICEENNALVFFQSTCSIEEQMQHSLRNEKKRQKKLQRERRRAEEGAVKRNQHYGKE